MSDCWTYTRKAEVRVCVYKWTEDESVFSRRMQWIACRPTHGQNIRRLSETLLQVIILRPPGDDGRGQAPVERGVIVEEDIAY